MPIFKFLSLFKRFSIFQPRFFSMIRSYNKQQMTSDLYSGIMVGLMTFPLAMAFAIASGVSPEKGLITSIIAGGMVSLLGGCRVQITGATAATVVIVAGIAQQYGESGLIMATFMAGCALVVIGLARLGSVLKFIPYPLMVGFTLGIALIIFSSQIKEFLGLSLPVMPAEFIPRWQAYFSALATLNLPAFAIGAGSLIFMAVWKRLAKKIPGVLITLILATVITQLLELPVNTLGTMKTIFPEAKIPFFDLNMIRELVQPAFTIALLVGMESLLSATVSDGLTGDKHHSNTELMAQGFANMVVPLFGGIPAAGTLSRTSANIQYRAKTPVSGLIHAGFLLILFLGLGKWAVLIPMPAIAALLMMVSYEMSEWRSFKAVLKSPREDVAVMALAFFLTVMVNLTVAIEVGMILAVFLFMRRMAISSNISVLSEDFKEQESKTDPLSIQTREIPDGVEVYEINGPLFFGAVEKFKEAVLQGEKTPRVRIIRMRYVPVIDSTGIRLLKDVFEDSVKKGATLILSGMNPEPLTALKQDGLYDLISEENFAVNIDAALNRAREILGIKKIRLAERIKKGGIYYNLEAEDMLSAIQKTIEIMPEIPKVSKKQILSAVISREEIMPTALGKGIVLPHTRNPLIKGLENEAVALVFLEKPIAYETPDRQPVHTLFLALSANSKTHLGMLSRISSLCSDEEFLKLLAKRPERKEILDWISEQEQD